MAPIVIIGLLAGVPVAVIFLLKSNAAIVFLALCAGSLLAQFVTTDATNIFNSFLPRYGSISYSTIQLSLLFAPALFTAMFTRKSMSGPRAILNLGSAVAVGGVGALLAVPFLAGGVQHNITTTDVWFTLQQYQAAIVGAGVLVSLFSLWFMHPKHSDKRKKHK